MNYFLISSKEFVFITEIFWRIFWHTFWQHYLTPYKTPAYIYFFISVYIRNHQRKLYCFLTGKYQDENKNQITDRHSEKVFSEKPRLLGFGRQIGSENVGAFWVFLAKLQCESLFHGLEWHSLEYLVVLLQKTLDFRPKTYNSQIWY